MNTPKEIVQKIDKTHLLRHFYLRKALIGSPIHFRQFPLMKFVAEHEGCSQSDIAEHFGISPAAVATSTKRLKKAGLLRKDTDEKNLRCNRLYLTEAGKDALLGHEAVFYDLDRAMIEGFSPAELETLSLLLDRMGENIAAAAGAADLDCHEIMTRMRKLDEKEEE